ncbi:hypothetical protein [Terriglobus sp.]|uniref:hypothetical protein n=1 Tax=Terriglobus sp. TaxID=1889013 RepID=UPI003AFFABBC
MNHVYGMNQFNQVVPRRSPLRTLITLALLAVSTSVAAQALPDAPSAGTPADRNPLPIVNGRHYRPPTAGENLLTLRHRLFSISALGSPLITAGFQMLNDQPGPEYWAEDTPGYFKRYGAAYGQRVIQAGTRYTLGTLLHEDNRYLLCHGCTFHDKLKNALLADFTARHGADGHRDFSLTGAAAGVSGPLVAYAFWYPNQDPNFTLDRGLRNSLIGFGTRPAGHMLTELLDGYRIPFTHRHIGEDNPTPAEQVPVGWTGPRPPKRRVQPAVPDPAGAYAEPAPALPPKP